MLVLAAFVAVLLLAVDARAGRLDSAFAFGGIAAILLIDGLEIVVPWLRPGRDAAQNERIGLLGDSERGCQEDAR
jgi:hypothetical protein